MSIIDRAPRGAVESFLSTKAQKLAAGYLHWPARMIGDAISVAEIIVVAGASLLAKHIYIALYLRNSVSSEPFLYIGIVCAFIYHYFARLRGLTEPAALQQGTRQWRSVLSALSTAFLLVVAAGFLFKVSATYSRGWLLIWFVFAAGGLIVARALTRRLTQWLARRGEFERRIAIVWAGGPIDKLKAAIETEPSAKLATVVQIDPQQIIKYAEAPSEVPSPLADLIEAAKEQKIDELIIRVPQLSSDQLGIIVNEVSILPVDIWLSTSDEELNLPIYGFGRVGAISLMQVRLRPIGGWGMVAKHILDYALSGLAVLALSPLFLAIAAAIKLDSKGPVLFRQRRHGWNELEITVLKFRTMSAAEDGPAVRQAMRHDPRVTRVGWFLRRTSLDELPQLINVLRGEMSLVGPRPHALVHNDYYRMRVRSYANRHKVKPGITGLAQINGLRGETDTPEKMQRRVELDLYYIDNWSIWLDLKILLLTPIYGLFGKNAF